MFLEIYRVLCELETKHVSQKFRAALAIHTYTIRDQRVVQALRITFKENLCPVELLIAWRYIQWGLVVVREEGTLYVADVPTVF